MVELLPLIFLCIIGFCIIMYVILDGFTLGTGIVMPFMTHEERDIAVSVILPTWDGNQTWLVLGMASLYGAFPLAFSTLLPIMYLPLLVMVVSLLFRGVVFEFRLKSHKGKRYWDWVFFLASLTAVLTQGVILGNVVQGFPNIADVTVIPPHQWITPFSIVTALSLVFGYGLLGSTRLILKTQGKIQADMYRIARVCAIIMALAMFIVSIWTAFIHPAVTQRWFDPTLMPYLAILPLATGIFFLLLLWGLYKKHDRTPWWCGVMMFLCPFAGFGVSIFPYIVPYNLTLWQAAAPSNTLEFLCIGSFIMVPVLCFYTWYSYHIFKGKVTEVIHY